MSAFDKIHNKRHDFQIPIAMNSGTPPKMLSKKIKSSLRESHDKQHGDNPLNPQKVHPVTTKRQYNPIINPHIPIEKQVRAQMDSIDRHQLAVQNGMKAMSPTPLGPIPENVRSVTKSYDHHEHPHNNSQDHLQVYQPHNRLDNSQEVYSES